jgi:hypothetical protein
MAHWPLHSSIGITTSIFKKFEQSTAGAYTNTPLTKKQRIQHTKTEHKQRQNKNNQKETTEEETTEKG